MSVRAVQIDAQGRTFAEYVGEQVAEAIFNSNQSIRAAAETSGINHMTLRRSLDGRRVFNLDEVACIAEALGIVPSDLMNAEGFRPV